MSEDIDSEDHAIEADLKNFYGERKCISEMTKQEVIERLVVTVNTEQWTLLSKLLNVEYPYSFQDKEELIKSIFRKGSE